MTFTSVAAQDGWILEGSENGSKGSSLSSTGTVLTVGDDASDRAYRAILSFDTSTIPDTATITRATVRLTRTSVAGTAYASLGACTLDISTAIGGNVAFAKTDWEGSVGVSSCASVPEPAANGSQVSTNVSAPGLAHVSKTGSTQFKVRFATQDNDDLAADTINFAAAEHGTASYRPVLEVEYTN